MHVGYQTIQTVPAVLRCLNQVLQIANFLGNNDDLSVCL